MKLLGEVAASKQALNDLMKELEQDEEARKKKKKKKAKQQVVE